VVPSANNMYDLGDDATPLRWRSGYFGTQVKVGASVSLVAATNELAYTGGDGRISVAGASALRVSTNGVERLIVDGSGNVLPSANNAYDLGSSTQRWANVYGVNGNFSAVTVSGLTPGSVIFAGTGGALSQDNANFFWDDANNRLGIGTNTPAATLDVVGTAQVSGNTSVGGNLTVDGNTTLGDNAAVDLVTFNARVGSDVVPSANNMYDLGDDATPLRWRSGYFGTQVKVGTSVSLVAATNELAYTGGDGRISVAGASALRVSTNGFERLRVTAAGDVVVQNQAAGTPTTVLRVLGGNGGAGATQVVLQAGTGQSGVNLLEWRDGTGQLIGVIDDAGFMGIGVNNAGFGGIAAYLHVYSNLAQPAAIFENGAVGIGTNAPAFGSTLHIYDARTAPGTGATKVIIQAGANQAGVNLLEWQDNTGLPVGFIDNAGNVAIGDVNDPGFTGAGAYLHVYSNTAQPAAIFQRGVVGIGTGAPAIGGPVLHVVGENPGAAARFEAGAGSTPLELQGVPTAAAADEVLRIDPATGEVKKSTVAAVISAGIIKGSFPIAASGSSFTISVAPADIQPGAIVTVTLVGPSGGTIYPLMVTNVNAVAETITVESSATIPGGMGYAIHYIIINP
jgi:hypothetical protein